MGKKAGKKKLVKVTLRILAVSKGQNPLQVFTTEVQGNDLVDLVNGMEQSLRNLGLTVQSETKAKERQIVFRVSRAQWVVPGVKEQVEGALQPYRPYPEAIFGGL